LNVLTPNTPPILDASVAVKWFLPEVHADFARRLLHNEGFTGNQRLQIPELFFAEIGNILWKHIRRKEMTLEQAQTLLEFVTALPFQIHPHHPLIETALVIAAQTQRTVYDSLYLALAIREGTVMITADERFYNALQDSPMANYVLWIEEIEVIRP
jgi:predicted nucleic acid-binding protein